MSTIKTIVGLTAAVIMTAACQSDKYHIKGEAHHLADGTILYITDDLSGTLHPTDTLRVSEGRFSNSGIADSAHISRLYIAGDTTQSILFFREPGTIYIELSDKPAASRVSGTVTNNRWQALNDSVAKYDRLIRQAVGQQGDSIAPRQLSAEMTRLYKDLTRLIRETGDANRDNALGRFITTHYEGY